MVALDLGQRGQAPLLANADGAPVTHAIRERNGPAAKGRNSQDLPMSLITRVPRATPDEHQPRRSARGMPSDLAVQSHHLRRLVSVQTLLHRRYSDGVTCRVSTERVYGRPTRSERKFPTLRSARRASAADRPVRAITIATRTPPPLTSNRRAR